MTTTDISLNTQLLLWQMAGFINMRELAPVPLPLSPSSHVNEHCYTCTLYYYYNTGTVKFFHLGNFLHLLRAVCFTACSMFCVVTTL